MPLYAILGRDGPRGLELRQQHRAAHLENLEALEARGRVPFAGPLRGKDGTPLGSVIVIEAESLNAARAFADSDPYVTGGVFETVEVFETMQVFPKKSTERPP